VLLPGSGAAAALPANARTPPAARVTAANAAGKW
jgi:hypothetical protein